MAGNEGTRGKIGLKKEFPIDAVQNCSHVSPLLVIKKMPAKNNCDHVKNTRKIMRTQ
jgi:hypothetical protein